jgi:hypothetical protein
MTLMVNNNMSYWTVPISDPTLSLCINCFSTV